MNINNRIKETFGGLHDFIDDHEIVEWYEELIKLCAAEHAKQESCKFIKWSKEKGWDTLAADENKWICVESQEVVKSTSELYELFLERKL